MFDTGVNGLATMLVALLFMAGPWLVVGGIATFFVRRSSFWKALSARVRDGSDGERLASLEGEVAELRQALAEMQERQDFAERLLSQQTERP